VSKARRGATALAGVLLVDKPAGMSSHGVIAALRRLTGEGRIGHAGTLDPEATGLLVVLFGPATKLSETLHAADKSYEATISFGTQTTTDDREGEAIATSVPPSEVFDPACAQALLDAFRGKQKQKPPQFSALKVAGERSYAAARKGRELDLAPRAIEVFEARLLAIDPVAQTWTVDFRVSKGTYIRALARDIGLAAGTHAHLERLRRTQSGNLRLADAHTLDEIEKHISDASGSPLAIADLFCERSTLETAGSGETALPYRVANPRHGAAVVALGVFDGVHRGHCALLSSARNEAERQGRRLVVLCFDPLPERVICPQKAPALLTDLKQRIGLLKHCGMDPERNDSGNAVDVEVIDFSPSLAQASPEFFTQQILLSRVTPTHLFVGENFHFGAGAKGDVTLMSKLLDCPVTALPLATDRDGSAISSTRIRELLANAQLISAYDLLGHTLDLCGTVVRGNGKGHALGYPTANLQLGPDRDPLCFSEGIYVATAHLNGHVYSAGLFIGHVSLPGSVQSKISIEAHLLDYTGPELYGQEMSLTVLSYVDAPRVFSTSRELAEAIGAWVFAIRKQLS